MLYAIKDAGELKFHDIMTREITTIIDYCNNFGVTLSSESVFATAKGQNRISFDQAKEGSITLSTQLGDASMFAMILGSELVTATEDVNRKQDGVVKDGKVTLKETPLAGSVAVLLNSERKILTEGELATADTVKVTGTEVSLDASHNGKDVKVFYLKANVKTTRFTVKSNDSSKAYGLTAITEAKTDASNESKFIELRFPKVKPKSNLSFEFDATNPSEFSMEFDILADGNGTMLEWIEA